MFRHLHSEGALPEVDVMGVDRLSEILKRIIRAQLEEEDIRVLRLCALVQCASLVDVAPAIGPAAELAVQRVAHVLPLVRLEGCGLRTTFSVHDILATLVINRLRIDGDPGACEGVNEALRLLDASGRLERLFAVLQMLGDSRMISEWLLKRGRELLSLGGLLALEQSFECLSVSDVIRRPELLLLQARMLSERGRIDDAVNKACVAQELAACDDDHLLRHDALMVQTRLHLDVHRLDRVRDCIRQAFNQGVPPERTAGIGLLHGYLAASLMACGEHDEAGSHRLLAIDSMCEEGGIETRARIGICLALMDGALCGRWDSAERYIRKAMRIRGLATFMRAHLVGNASHCLLELGRADEALEAAEQAVAMGTMYGLEAIRICFASNAAPCVAAKGQYSEADRIQSGGERLQLQFGDKGAVCAGLSYQCQWVLAAGESIRALSLAERNLELAMDFPVEYTRLTARSHLAAAVLAIGDTESAQRMAAQVGEQARLTGLKNVELAADLIECECSRVLDQENIDRPWAEHAEYIATGSMNWRLAMMIRAFPGMLITLIERGIADAVPRRCLNLILPENWRAILAIAGDYTAETERLMLRAGVDIPQCETSTLYVRMFGGLDVRVGDRTITKQEWRKRRARLILAMLVLEQGNELARDKISEYLWPEVEGEKATNNFYVAWSAMKNAIMPGADKMTKLPYFESAHGLCRAVMTDIVADVAEFSDLIVSVRRAQQSGDVTALLSACQRLAEIYRGELLPGDLYDDWFAAARDKYRREFGDTMRAGATALLDANLPEECVSLLRKGVEEDPWREDLYQLLLRAHMASGQRGAAIDVYLSCRHRLSEDLGLDPSAETLRLYEEILAMEEAETRYGSGTAEENSRSSEDG
jgi:DNA-binding SARP family transcriptional activator